MLDSDLTQGAGALDVKGAVELLEGGSTAADKQSWSPQVIPAGAGLFGFTTLALPT